MTGLAPEFFEKYAAVIKKGTVGKPLAEKAWDLVEEPLDGVDGDIEFIDEWHEAGVSADEWRHLIEGLERFHQGHLYPDLGSQELSLKDVRQAIHFEVLKGVPQVGRSVLYVNPDASARGFFAFCLDADCRRLVVVPPGFRKTDAGRKAKELGFKLISFPKFEKLLGLQEPVAEGDSSGEAPREEGEGEGESASDPEAAGEEEEAAAGEEEAAAVGGGGRRRRANSGRPEMPANACNFRPAKDDGMDGCYEEAGHECRGVSHKLWSVRDQAFFCVPIRASREDRQAGRALMAVHRSPPPQQPAGEELGEAADEGAQGEGALAEMSADEFAAHEAAVQAESRSRKRAWMDDALNMQNLVKRLRGDKDEAERLLHEAVADKNAAERARDAAVDAKDAAEAAKDAALAAKDAAVADKDAASRARDEAEASAQTAWAACSRLRARQQ